MAIPDSLHNTLYNREDVIIGLRKIRDNKLSHDEAYRYFMSRGLSKVEADIIMARYLTTGEIPDPERKYLQKYRLESFLNPIFVSLLVIIFFLLRLFLGFHYFTQYDDVFLSDSESRYEYMEALYTSQVNFDSGIYIDAEDFSSSEGQYQLGIYTPVNWDQVALGISFLLFLIWVYVSYRNFRSFNPAGEHLIPIWSWLGFVIPIIQLIIPYRVLQKIWWGSSPSENVSQAKSYSMQSNSIFVVIWWLVYVIYMTLSYFIRIAPYLPNAIYLMAIILFMLFNISTIFLVLMLSTRQLKKYRQLT